MVKSRFTSMLKWYDLTVACTTLHNFWLRTHENESYEWWPTRTRNQLMWAGWDITFRKYFGAREFHEATTERYMLLKNRSIQKNKNKLFRDCVQEKSLFRIDDTCGEHRMPLLEHIL